MNQVEQADDVAKVDEGTAVYSEHLNLGAGPQDDGQQAAVQKWNLVKVQDCQRVGAFQDLAN